MTNDTNLRWRYCGEEGDYGLCDWDLIEEDENGNRISCLAFISCQHTQPGWFVWVIGNPTYEHSAGPILDIEDAKAVALALGRMEDKTDG